MYIGAAQALLMHPGGGFKPLYDFVFHVHKMNMNGFEYESKWALNVQFISWVSIHAKCLYFVGV